MTPDQKFARYVKISLVGFILLFAYFVVADMFLPVTPQARVYHPVVQVTPQVSGRVNQVLVNNNQAIKTGEALFLIEAAPFKLALEQAQLAYADAQLQNQRLDSSVKAIQAQLAAGNAKLHEQQLLFDRSESLLKKRSISEQEYETISANYQSSKANVAAIEAQLTEAKLARGQLGEDNLALRHAQNQLAQAKLNLSYSIVTADADGKVANLQVSTGTFANKGQPMLAVVANKADLVADFREKSLVNIKVGSKAKVTFDALPGQVFAATVNSFEAGVSNGQLNANGLLSSTESSNRWVRDAQRQRIHIDLEQAQLLSKLPSGARATVQLLPESVIGQWFGVMQIRFISLLHYIY
ncbi:HlyD family secretion protein [Pseudoalteromonas sp. SR44-5]|uniref:HlyD family secretion protein n=1 Tax=Pseudoalteromonas TaxID=53246 RepID=UPI00123097B5|nr:MULTISPECIES: HlyD family secretion protein [Pseudoalteromonas]MBB1340384.1 HlyD family secretion protein [Pseudoalteromonas sp. SR45-6]MBB1365320.1 HlyD family secretion protein [Pseudoalteromonas sp. SR44-5]MBB1416878.1 HlyD family secretion protein [Pseudoalteromonas sp. SG44-1]MBB1421471.1 HlyD family secretion protein [Pseudoalteromonas sp. SG43-7]MBB1434005.1 HlyD family secretion protein [Pseudoalteromonas sp. SG43-6]